MSATRNVDQPPKFRGLRQRVGLDNFFFHLCVCLLVGVVVNAWAIAPAFVSDEELARSTVIVVARWDKAPIKGHHRYEARGEERVITAIEGFTELNILRVIKGEVKPGVQPLMVGWGVSWAKDGNWVSSGTSTELAGDVENVTQTNIWFLKGARSWDEKDKTHYLCVSNYRAIQPLALERYFAALASTLPQTEVPKLLTSTNEITVRRSLQYVCGGVLPWPYGMDFMEEYFRPEKKARVLRENSRAVADVVKRKELMKVRPLAVAVYAELEGARCVGYVQSLLTDPDQDVRTLAVAVLARQKANGSLDGIVRTITGKEEGRMACKIIEAISEWGDVRLVPALVAFLESGKLVYQNGDDLGIPALKAREALHRLTGHWFPYEVQSSLDAWQQVSAMTDFTKRKDFLARVLPNDATPLRAEVVGDGSTNAACRITNRSKQNVIISKFPDWAEQSWPGGMASVLSCK